MLKTLIISSEVRIKMIKKLKERNLEVMTWKLMSKLPEDLQD